MLVLPRCLLVRVLYLILKERREVGREGLDGAGTWWWRGDVMCRIEVLGWEKRRAELRGEHLADEYVEYAKTGFLRSIQYNQRPQDPE
jgi:hypothetical protein